MGKTIIRQPPYNITETEQGVYEVHLYGEVVQEVPVDFWTGEKVDGLFIELKQFLKDLDSYRGAKKIIFRINSVGGDVNAGRAIYSQIRGFECETVTVVDGLAASAASIIAQAGDKRIVNVGSQVMIHGASVGLLGYYNKNELEKEVSMLESVNNAVAEIYADRTGHTHEEILEMMEAESWLTSNEAVEKGFADEVGNKSEKPVVDRIEGDNQHIIVNGVEHFLRGKAMPTMDIRQIISAREYHPKNEVVNGREPSAIDNTFHREENEMDLKELKANHPDLVEEIRNEALLTAQTQSDDAVKDALEKDRVRMQEIDSIAKMIGDQALVQKAKYEEPITAAELAFMAMKAQQAAGNEFLATRAQEVNNSVSTPANDGMENTVANDEQELNALIDKIKEVK